MCSAGERVLERTGQMCYVILGKKKFMKKC